LHAYQSESDDEEPNVDDHAADDDGDVVPAGGLFVAPPPMVVVFNFGTVATNWAAMMLNLVSRLLGAAFQTQVIDGIVVPLFVRMGTMSYLCYLYNVRIILAFLLLCWFSGKSATHSALSNILSVVNVVFQTLFGKQFGFRLTLQSLLARFPRLAAYCTVSPMILCPICNTVRDSKDCLYTDVTTGNVMSVVCQTQEFPNHGQRARRVGCNHLLLGKQTVRTKGAAGHVLSIPAPFPENKFIWLGAKFGL